MSSASASGALADREIWPLVVRLSKGGVFLVHSIVSNWEISSHAQVMVSLGEDPTYSPIYCRSCINKLEELLL